jgi:hypothetical protein
MSVAPRIKPRVVGVLPQETRLRIANERKARCILTRALGSLCQSGSFARVKMMQAAHLWDLDHLAKRGRLDRSADRRILFERHSTFRSMQNTASRSGATQPHGRQGRGTNTPVEWTRSSAPRRRFAMVIAAQSGLPEYPSISLSHKTSLHKCCPGRAANSAGHCPTGMLPKVDGLSIQLWG